ncbi:MAG TPA: DNA methyltransferase, partial [Gemmatimonadaceae bacterium]|nr:DNA methyltransferase [Gemmatimonadaceae bacterium]
MLSLRDAAHLLAACTSIQALSAVASALGFTGQRLPLDQSTRVSLGLDPLATDTSIARGQGALRALLVRSQAGISLRDAIVSIAASLSARSPLLLWMVFGIDSDGGQVGLAVWSAECRRPRVAALLVERDAIAPSDAETLCALASIPRVADVLTHARWLEILGRDALTRRFYRALERLVRTLAEGALGVATLSDRRELALLHISRLLFLSFIETKGWLNDDRRFLENAFADCMAGGGRFHQRVLLPLFFGTLNTAPAHRAREARAFGRIPFLNGGLFNRAPVERRCRTVRFEDETLGMVFGDLLSRYRFTAREDTALWTEAAVDPEMLGKVFESLMATADRRSSGAFYTPQSLVVDVTRSALLHALCRTGAPSTDVERALDGAVPDRSTGHLLRERLATIAVLDPACGSGAFLVHALEELAALAARSGDTRPIAAIRRALLTRSIFGVDVNPTAVWLCELRLWLSVVIESREADPLAVVPLPNLDRHIRAGDALSGAGFDDAIPLGGSAIIARLRERYAHASGARKRTVERELERRERALAIAHTERELMRSSACRRDLLTALRGRDLFGERHQASAAARVVLDAERRRSRELRALRRSLRERGALPFSFETNFPDVASRGGFDVVLGNPPWVRLHRIPALARATLRARFAVFRNAAWETGASVARAGRGFATQVDLAALFVERSLSLLRDGGTLALLLPAKLWRSLAGGGVRAFVRQRSHVIALDDWSASPAAFDAAVYPMLLVAERHAMRADAVHGVDASGQVAAALHRSAASLRWSIPESRLSLDGDLASPWIVAPPAVREAFDRVRDAGIPLARTRLGRPLLGVKCGCNDAFIVLVDDDDEGERVRVCWNGRSGNIERRLLRPLLRGEGVRSWSAAASRERLVWTHTGSGSAVPLEQLPPGAAHWLAPWRRTLQARADGARRHRWWSLFRTPAAATECARVVWADFGRAPRALVLPAGDPTVPLNSCYVVPCQTSEDAFTLAALLNSPLAAAWLSLLAEPARGGYHRYLAWTMSLLPL